MADIRINSLPSTATTPASDDYFALDGAANGTRKILATNVANNVSDVILGASGPSVKSTLSARAPRQGLVFDGTNGVTATLGSALGTSAFSWSGWVQIPSTPAAYSVLGGVGTTTNIFSIASSLHLVWQNTGKLRIQIVNATNNGGVYADVDGFSSLVGKIASLSITRSGSTLAVYINGIAQTVTPATYGSSPGDFSNTVSGTTVLVGGSGGGSGTLLSGYASAPLIYNRALSASEVVALYEAGAPSGADYNSASNTSVVTAWTNTGTAFTSFSSASASAFTVTAGAGQGSAESDPDFALKVGQKIRVTGSVASISGTIDVYLAFSTGGLASAIQQISGNGAFDLTFVSTANTSVGAIRFSSAGAWAGTFTSLSITRQGLLLAPDAAQAGGGLVWYDTSGNAANITLPASGVSWNVPTSGYVTSGSSLNLSAGGTNQNITLTPSGNGFAQIVGGSLAVATFIKGGGFAQGVSLGTTGSVPFLQGYASNTFASTANLAVQPTGGNVLIGKSTPDTGEKLQVSGTAAITGAVTIGKDNSGSLDSSLTITATSDNADLVFKALTTSTKRNRIRFYNSLNDEQARIQSGGEVSNSYGNIVFSTSGASGLTTALTLDSSQRAQFAATTDSTSTTTGALTVAGGVGIAKAAYVGGGLNVVNAGNLTSGIQISGASDNIALDFSNTGTGGLGAAVAVTSGASGFGQGKLVLVKRSDNTSIATFDIASKAATFAGSIAIGNTVNTVSPTSPNRTITMVIGGTTYYIHAKTTND